jgi:hypothetical protein
MQITEIPNSKAEGFLLKNFSSPTHWPDWNLLVSKYNNTSFYYWGLFEKGTLIGICPIHETKTGLLKNLYSGQFHLIPNGGWLLNREFTLNPSDFPLSHNSKFECFTLPQIKEFGVKYTKFTKLNHTLLLDLRQEEDEIWKKSINAKRRNMIRKAKKNGVSVKKDEINLANFYSVYSMANERYGLSSLPLDFFKELQESKNVRFIPMLAYYNDSPYGALGLIYDKDYAFYWLGASVENSENMGQGDLLQWEAIKHSQENGCKYYDLCYIEKEKLPHIYEFKRGFAKTEVQIPYLNRKKLFFKVLNKLQKLL